MLNDLCSIRNWVALPEISAGLTLKLSFILGRLQRVGWSSQDRDLTGVEESKAALSALFKGQAEAETLLTSIYEALQPILSQGGIYELINASDISDSIIFRLGRVEQRRD